MTAKEYLKQLNILEAKYKCKCEEVHDLRLLATSTGALRYDKERVQTSNDGDQIVNAVIKIIEAENEALRLAIELADTKQEIVERIVNLDDGNHIRLLCLYYVRNYKLEEVANKMHFSFDWTRHLHKEALAAFEKKYIDIAEL